MLPSTLLTELQKVNWKRVMWIVIFFTVIYLWPTEGL